MATSLELPEKVIIVVSIFHCQVRSNMEFSLLLCLFQGLVPLLEIVVFCRGCYLLPYGADACKLSPKFSLA